MIQLQINTNKTTLDYLRESMKYEFMGTEKDFEENVILHLEQICECLELPKIESIHRQKIIKMSGIQGKMDIVVRHTDQTATIFEVKKVNTKYPSTGTSNQMQGIGQLLLYQNLFEAKTGGKPRLVLIDSKIFERTYLSFIGNNIPITLVEFQKDILFIPYKAW